MLRCLKNDNGVIVAMGNDELQSGADEVMAGTWCTWTIEPEDIPALTEVDGADPFALRFKENGAQDGIELRSDEDVLAEPQG